MERTVNYYVSELVSYAIEKGLTSPADKEYVINKLLFDLKLDSFCECEISEKRELQAILDDLVDYAYEKGLIESDTVVYRDLFDTHLMGELTEAPSVVIDKFGKLYEASPEAATDYFYKLCCDSNYIRRDRIKKDLKWKVGSEYGDIDITVNLSKPEKDPKAIAAAKLIPQSDYPK